MSLPNFQFDPTKAEEVAQIYQLMKTYLALQADLAATQAALDAIDPQFLQQVITEMAAIGMITILP